MKLNNTYFILRHGEAKSNKERFVSCWPEKIYNPLTPRGIKKIKELIPILKKEKIDLIFSSDLLRTKQTAEIIAKQLKLKVNFDKRIREHNFGIFNRKPEDEWIDFFVKIDRFKDRPPGGENWMDIKKRVSNFVKEINKKYRNKEILVITHGDVLLSFQWMFRNLSREQVYRERKELRLSPGKFIKL